MDHLEPNKKVVLRAWQAYDKGDEAGFAACLADGWTEHDASGGSATLEQVRESMIREMLICRLSGGRIVESWQIASDGFMEQLTGTKATAGDNQA